jgi:hypothetical protein
LKILVALLRFCLSFAADEPSQLSAIFVQAVTQASAGSFEFFGIPIFSRSCSCKSTVVLVWAFAWDLHKLARAVF